jgi:hypothetical protein
LVYGGITGFVRAILLEKTAANPITINLLGFPPFLKASSL